MATLLGSYVRSRSRATGACDHAAGAIWVGEAEHAVWWGAFVAPWQQTLAKGRAVRCGFALSYPQRNSIDSVRAFLRVLGACVPAGKPAWYTT